MKQGEWCVSGIGEWAIKEFLEDMGDTVRICAVSGGFVAEIICERHNAVLAAQEARLRDELLEKETHHE